MVTGPNTQTATLGFTGDIMLAGKVRTLIDQAGPEAVFAEVSHLLKDFDLLIGNFEFPCSTDAQPGLTATRPEFRCRPESVQALQSVPWDIMSLANNHILDWGAEGISTTRKLLAESGIDTTGAGLNRAEAAVPVIRQCQGITFGFLAYVKPGPYTAGDSTPGAALLELNTVIAEVRRLKDQVDHVIVLLHWGVEFSQYPHPDDVRSAHAIIDAGTSVIIGHHPHILQGIEQYGQGLIAYSLGNFVTDMTADRAPKEEAWQLGHAGGVLALEFNRDQLLTHSFSPAIIDAGMQTRPCTDSERSIVLERLDTISSGIDEAGFRFHEQAVGNIWQREVAAVKMLVREKGWRGVIAVLKTLKWRHLTMIFRFLISRLKSTLRKGES